MLQKPESTDLEVDAVGMRRREAGRQADLGRQGSRKQVVWLSNQKNGKTWEPWQSQRKINQDSSETLLPALLLKDSESHLNLLIGLRPIIKGYPANVLPPRVSSAHMGSHSEVTRTLEVFFDLANKSSLHT